MEYSVSSTQGTLQKFRDEDCLEEASPCGSKLGRLVCFGKHIKKAGEGEKHINFHFRDANRGLLDWSWMTVTE